MLNQKKKEENNMCIYGTKTVNVKYALLMKEEERL